MCTGLDSRFAIGRSPAKIDFVGRPPFKRRVGTMFVVPIDERKKLPTTCFSTAGNQNSSSALVLHALDHTFNCAGPAIFARSLNRPKHVDVIAVIVFLSDFSIRTPENTMPAKKAPRIPLPKAWTRQVRSAMLHLISLAQYVTVYTRSWAVDSMNGRVRLKAENDRLRQEIALLREESHYPCAVGKD